MEVDLKLIIEGAAALLALGGTLYMVKDHHTRISKNETGVSGLNTEVGNLVTIMEFVRDDLKEIKADLKAFYISKT